MDHKSFRYLMDQPNLNMRQHRWLDVVKDYDFEILYHPGKANVVANTLSRKVVAARIRDIYLRRNAGSASGLFSSWPPLIMTAVGC